jgi:hypothetical protein
MELALPVLLYLFPNMLPSTFTSQLKREENLQVQMSTAALRTCWT